jgi:hypothetical protein
MQDIRFSTDFSHRQRGDRGQIEGPKSCRKQMQYVTMAATANDLQDINELGDEGAKIFRLLQSPPETGQFWVNWLEGNLDIGMNVKPLHQLLRLYRLPSNNLERGRDK